MNRDTLRFVRYMVRLAFLLPGVRPRQCPCCGHIGKFRAFGFPPRFDAECPKCGALERHRLFVLVCERIGVFAGPRDVLHFAPEHALRIYLRARARAYITADLSGMDVDRIEDIECLSFANESVDVVVCSHVLEHVDDTKALRELRRILRPDGLLLCMVPIIEGWDRTYENPSVRTPAARAVHFGQHDHLRMYGRDFPRRLASAGFQVVEHTATGELSVRFGLLFGEKVFACYKSAVPREIGGEPATAGDLLRATDSTT